jgi:CubicO group peptidase (beta-lactamase class C family)
MRTASFRRADYLARENRAWLHGGKAAGSSPSMTATQMCSPDVQSPAGGATASITDMARSLQLHLGDGMLDGQRLIPATLLRETRSAQIERVPAAQSPSGNASYYAPGWNYIRAAKDAQKNDHSGAFVLGAATCVNIGPDQALGIVVLTNGALVGLPEAAATTSMELALDSAVSQDWSALYSDGIREQSEEEFKGPTDYSIPPTQPAPAQPASTYASALCQPLLWRNQYRGTGWHTVFAAGPAMNRLPDATLEQQPIRVSAIRRKCDRNQW